MHSIAAPSRWMGCAFDMAVKMLASTTSEIYTELCIGFRQMFNEGSNAGGKIFISKVGTPFLFSVPGLCTCRHGFISSGKALKLVPAFWSQLHTLGRKQDFETSTPFVAVLVAVLEVKNTSFSCDQNTIMFTLNRKWFILCYHIKTF